ncbi:MAG TPA: NAD(P)/FAD-dependent oxidoreductase [Flavitalea sp.]|nr:NAD(P)/FAD-dependent oxidoreductase [Flavitalea sp.]
MRLVVIGGGAAGFFCAVNAARLHPSLSVMIVERTSKLLSKVRISGGGRCNLTHACFEINEMSKRYPRGEQFVRKAFHRFFTTDTIEWFNSRSVPTKAEEDGRMFPTSDSSETIIACLLKEANRHKVEIRLNRDVKEINRTESSWTLKFADDEFEEADFVCIATGGQPKSSMFNWIRNLGHSIEAPVPSLFTFNIPGHDITSLMGVAVQDGMVKIAGSKLSQHGPILITHWGLSGPAVLKLSAWGARELAEKQYDFAIQVNWLPQYNEQTFRSALLEHKDATPLQLVVNRNPFGLPHRLWQYLVVYSEIPETMRWADLALVKLNKLVRHTTSFEMSVKGKTTYKEEFVTAGGVVLQEVNVQTMESKKHPNLFFAGEILNVDGITGGYNFQHAWTSGFIAAEEIASRALNAERDFQD